MRFVKTPSLNSISLKALLAYMALCWLSSTH
jgi:hypothetical protein